MNAKRDAPRKVVRITGRRNGMITFDYGLGDLSYALELMLPPAAFAAFCREHGVEHLPEAPADAAPGADPEENGAARAMALRPSDVGPRL